MKKSILFLVIALFAFTACEQNVGVDNENVYGVWVCENEGLEISDTEREHLLFIINEGNTKFVSEDSIAISHGYWLYSEGSDLGYITYKYELMKGKKLRLTRYDVYSDTESTLEFTSRPDLLPVIENYIYDKKNEQVTSTKVNNLIGKWECVKTENLDSSKVEFTKHVIDTLENTTLEFTPNTIASFYNGSIVNNGEKFSIQSMPPYRIIITKKDKGIINDRVMPTFSGSVILFRFPMENQKDYYHFGGSHYSYNPSSVEKGELILKDQYSDTEIIFKKIE